MNEETRTLNGLVELYLKGAKGAFVIAILLMVQGVIPFVISRVYAEELNPLNYPENWCLSFDGSDDYVSCGFSEVFRLDNFTIETWIKPKYDIQVGSNSVYGHQWGILVSRRSTSMTAGYDCDFDYSTGLLYFRLYSGGVYTYFTNKAVWYSSSWYHIAVTYDRSLPSGNLRFFINASLDSQHDSTRKISHANYALLLGNLGGSAYGGLMDEVRVWNISRTQSEIQETMLRTLNNSEAVNPNLVGYWRFDEGTGMHSVDYSGYGNDAAFPAAPAIPEWTPIGAPIAPEFPSVLVLPLFIILSMLVIAIRKRKIIRKPKT